MKITLSLVILKALLQGKPCRIYNSQGQITWEIVLDTDISAPQLLEVLREATQQSHCEHTPQGLQAKIDGLTEKLHKVESERDLFRNGYHQAVKELVKITATKD